jgi:hypothetical protein
VLTVADDSSNGPQTINLSYSSGFAGPLLIDLGSRSIGTQGIATDDNVPGYPASSITFSVTGPDASDFSVVAGYPSTNNVCLPNRLSPACSFVVTFTPSALGLRTATVNVNGNPLGGVMGVGLPAGVQFTTILPSSSNPIFVSSINFYTGVIGQPSPATVIDVENTGTVPMTLSTPVLSGQNASDFNVVSQCTSSIAPNQKCALSITASPTQPTNRAATLTLTDSTDSAQRTLLLKVLGLNPPPVATPATLTFSYTPMDTVSAPQSFTVTSYNNDPVSATVLDGPYLPFVLTGPKTCAQTPCQIALTFAPTQLNTVNGSNGIAYGTILITDLFSGQAFRLSVSGAFQPPPVTSWTVLPSTLTFAAQTVGSSSTAQNITLTNTGNQEIDFSVQAGGYQDINDFKITNTCKGVVAGGATCTIGVVFTPQGTGIRSYTLRFYSNAPTSPESVVATGTGQ